MNREFLETQYEEFTHTDRVGFDPIRFVLKAASAADQEVIGLVSASLAYGNVKQISASMDLLSSVMGDHPADWIRSTSASDRAAALPRFQHRWTHREDILSLWDALHRVLHEFGSLEACFASGMEGEEGKLEGGLNRLVDRLLSGSSSAGLRVLSKPQKGSGCKRMLMYLRWMVRNDAVDPGPWNCLLPSQLMMPLDTHIYRTACRYHLTRRKNVNWRTVEEVTQRFREVCPEDPVRYDFALTRLGMKGRDALDEAVRGFWGI